MDIRPLPLTLAPHGKVIADYAREFDHMVEEDRTRYLDDLAAQNEMLAL